jgi:hypothetical protein
MNTILFYYSYQRKIREEVECGLHASCFASFGFTRLIPPMLQNFISKCLESKEATITKLNDDGETLMASGHPGKNVIEV